MRDVERRLLLREAMKIGAQVVFDISPYINQSCFVGSLGRGKDTVGDIDVLVEVADPYEENIEWIRDTVNSIANIVKGRQRVMIARSLYGRDLTLELMLAWPPTHFETLKALKWGPAEASDELEDALLGHGYDRPHAQIYVPEAEELFKLAGLVPPVTLTHPVPLDEREF